MPLSWVSARLEYMRMPKGVTACKDVIWPSRVAVHGTLYYCRTVSVLSNKPICIMEESI